MDTDREAAVTIMEQTYGHRGLARMALELAEALDEYADHQSWRCAYPPHWYMVNPSHVPEGDCPCGLLGTLARLGVSTLRQQTHTTQGEANGIQP